MRRTPLGGVSSSSVFKGCNLAFTSSEFTRPHLLFESHPTAPTWLYLLLPISRSPP